MGKININRKVVNASYRLFSSDHYVYIQSQLFRQKLAFNHDFKITGEETTYRFVLNNILNVNNNFFQFQKT